MGERVEVGHGFQPLELGGNTTDEILGAIGDGISAFFSTYQMNKEAKAKIALKQQEFAIKKQEIEAKERYQMNIINNQAVGQQLKHDESMAASDARRFAATEATNRQQSLLDWRQNVDFPHQDQLQTDRLTAAQNLRATVPGGTQLIEEGRNQRAANYRAMGMVQKLTEQGLLNPTLPDGSPNPDYQKQVADAYYFYSLDPEEQMAYLEEQAKAEEEKQAEQDAADEQDFQENTLPEMRQSALGVLGSNPETMKRIDLLEQQNGGGVSFQDIYGMPAEDVIGPPGEIPTPYLNEPDQQGEILRKDKKGGYVPNMDPLNNALKFLNRQTKSTIRERLKKLRSIPEGSKPAGARSEE